MAIHIMHARCLALNVIKLGQGDALTLVETFVAICAWQSFQLPISRKLGIVSARHAMRLPATAPKFLSLGHRSLRNYVISGFLISQSKNFRAFRRTDLSSCCAIRESIAATSPSGIGRAPHNLACKMICDGALKFVDLLDGLLITLISFVASRHRHRPRPLA